MNSFHQNNHFHYVSNTLKEILLKNAHFIYQRRTKIQNVFENGLKTNVQTPKMAILLRKH